LTVEKFEGKIWDPACGFGRIVENARRLGIQASGSDIVDRGFGNTELDFLGCIDMAADNIICNPPFKLAREFTLHGLKMAKRKVAVIFPTARLNAAHWLEPLPLARVWLLTPRPSMRGMRQILEIGWPGAQRCRAAVSCSGRRALSRSHGNRQRAR
jgi:hypothetical protein